MDWGAAALAVEAATAAGPPPPPPPPLMSPPPRAAAADPARLQQSRRARVLKSYPQAVPDAVTGRQVLKSALELPTTTWGPWQPSEEHHEERARVQEIRAAADVHSLSPANVPPAHEGAGSEDDEDDGAHEVAVFAARHPSWDGQVKLIDGGRLRTHTSTAAHQRERRNEGGSWSMLQAPNGGGVLVIRWDTGRPPERLVTADGGRTFESKEYPFDLALSHATCTRRGLHPGGTTARIPSWLQCAPKPPSAHDRLAAKLRALGIVPADDAAQEAMPPLPPVVGVIGCGAVGAALVRGLAGQEGVATQTRLLLAPALGATKAEEDAMRQLVADLPAGARSRVQLVASGGGGGGGGG
eukprot:SAG22_NODE_3240_length_1836_cov_4.237191_3_plen_354_part_01